MIAIAQAAVSRRTKRGTELAGLSEMPQNPKSSKADEDQNNLDSEEIDMDPDDRKIGERTVRAGRDDDEGLEEQHGHRVSRKSDGDDDDDLAEDSMEALDEDDLKNMEGPDA